jgi:hypothetical protein
MLQTKENLHILTDISLAKYKTWSIDGDRRGDVITCLNGTLWITQEGDLKDYVVEAGRSFWVTRIGTVVVQALDESQFKYSLNDLTTRMEDNRQPLGRMLHGREKHFLR